MHATPLEPAAGWSDEVVLDARDREALPPHRWFLFRGRWGVTGRSAANVAELHDELERAGPDVVQHHVACGDFSRWIQIVVKDDQLALAFSAIERAAKETSDPTRVAVEEWRRGLLRAIEDRYR